HPAVSPPGAVAPAGSEGAALAAARRRAPPVVVASGPRDARRLDPPAPRLGLCRLQSLWVDGSSVSGRSPPASRPRRRRRPRCLVGPIGSPLLQFAIHVIPYRH